MTTFFSVFAGLFVVYIVLDWGMDITGRKHASRLSESQEIGKVNGVSISTREFADLVKRQSDNQKTQSGTDPDENQLRMIRDQVWNEIVDDHLYNEEVKKFGITVSDKEIYDWVFGDNPPEFLRQQFVDSTGTFDRVTYERVLKDSRNKSKLIPIEDALRKQREREKLQSLILASVTVSEGDVLQQFLDRNTKYEIEYALFDPNSLVPDNQLNPSADDLRRYYNENSNDFKIEATRKLKYVQFSYAASAKDSEEVKFEIDDLRKRALAGTDFLELAKTYSETPVTETFHKHGELGADRETAIFEAKAGDVLEPRKEFDGYHLIKVLEFRNGKDEFVRTSHILVNIENNDSAAALKHARELLAKVKGGANFADVARAESKDVGSAVKGGDLGWFGKGRMQKPFEDAAYKAKPGQIVGPVRTAFGYHIIKLTGRDNREVKVADIHMPIRMSAATRGDLDQKAQDFDYLAHEGDFIKEAAAQQLTVGETPAFTKGTNVPGLGVSSAINRFAFSNKVGTVSNVMSLINGVAVVMVSEVKEAGIRPFDDVRSLIETRVKREQKIEKTRTMAEELRKQLSPGDPMKKLETLRPGLAVMQIGNVSLADGVPGFGRDMSLLGGISALNAGDISKPIEANRGLFIVHVLDKSSFDSTAFNQQKSTMYTQLLSERRNRFISEWSDQLKKSADIVDNRDTFYH